MILNNMVSDGFALSSEEEEDAGRGFICKDPSGLSEEPGIKEEG